MRFLVLLCLSCAATAPAEKPIAIAPPTALPVVEKKPDWSELRAKLDRSKVSGQVLLDRAVTMSPTKDVVKSEGKSSGGTYADVLEDVGTAIRIRSETLVADYVLEGFVPRAALVPVLAHPIVKDNPDGTGFVLEEGLELALGDRIAPANLLLAKLPVELAAADVTLGFAPVEKEPELAKVDGTVLGCARADNGSTRIADPDTLQKERREKWRAEHPNAAMWEGPYSMGMRGFNQDPCRIASDYDFKEHTDRKDAELKVGGASLGKASAAQLERIEVRRAKGSDVLVTFTERRATVRALVSDSVLAWGGGGMGIGGLGGKPPMVWAVQGEATAYYADGTKAGTHEKSARPTKMRGAHEVGGRMCYGVMHVAVELCHDKSDVKEIEDRRF